MATVRDSDTSLWLHNKLGTSNDSWTGGSICSQLNAEVLRNIKDCFPDLQTQVKLKLLLSFFHIPRRSVEEWRVELEEILEVAQVDSEQWVSMMAEIMKTYPSTGSLNTDISEVDENKRIFSDLVNDLKKLVKKQTDMDNLPLECHYLNKNALASVVSTQNMIVKHFTLKRKPKSAALRVELLAKSLDAASNLKKNTGPSVPVRSRGMPRKMTDTTPLKGIPSRVPSGGFRSPGISNSLLSRPALPRTPAGRKDGGIKLLDITEQPLGYAQAKKRKRMQEIEEANKKAAAADLAQQANATPDYAAGLTPSNPPTSAPTTGTNNFAPKATSPSTPIVQKSLLPLPETLIQSTPPTPKVVPSKKPQQNFTTLNPTPGKVSVLNTRKTIVVNPGTIANLGTPLFATNMNLTGVNLHNSHNSLTNSNPNTLNTATLHSILSSDIDSNCVTKELATSKGGQLVELKHQVTQIKIQQSSTSSTPGSTSVPTNKKGLSLTREQMLEAQNMFRTANKVTRPEKALILGFMAGSRENPCPDLGNIVTIKLSEDQENVLQLDDSYLPMMAETHFQMNYNTGEWKRIKKYRKCDEQSTINIAKPHSSSAAVPASII